MTICVSQFVGQGQDGLNPSVLFANMLSHLEVPGWFVTTRWTVVLEVGRDPSPAATEALEQLCRTYWYPLYAYVRRRGYPAPVAEDLVQGFFEQLIEKGYLADVDRSKGKFRSFLLTAINHFLANEADKQKAQKRGGTIDFFYIDDVSPEKQYALEPRTNDSPERLYERRFAIIVLQQAMDRLRSEYDASGKIDQFERLKEFLSDRPAGGEYEQAGAELGLTLSAVTSLVHRMRGRYRELVRLEVSQTVANPSEIDAELRHLLQIFSG